MLNFEGHRTCARAQRDEEIIVTLATHAQGGAKYLMYSATGTR